MGVLTSKRVLVTGGTGSFGQEVVPRLLKDDAEKVLVYSRDEYKQSVMRGQFSNEGRLEFVLGDIRDTKRLMDTSRNIHYVIHAAAMKQLPSCEENPSEAILTNVIGTRNVIQAAHQNAVEKVVNLSADKAVYSTSVYGATKLLAERLFIQANIGGATRFVNLRYSNVLDSRGGVFEIFRRKLESGESITVFDPRMTRFFLTQAQVVDLCLFALDHGVGGETFVRLAPPVNIRSLAEAMCRVSGKGTVQVLQDQGRPGEKLEAVLLSAEESLLASLWNDTIFIINTLKRSLPFEGLGPVAQKDHTVDDYEAMSKEELERLVVEAWR